jgi:hypothetical protein
MNKVVAIICCTAIIVTGSGCIQESSISSENVKIYHADVSGNRYNQIFQWDDLVDSVEIIRLETNEQSLVGQFTKGFIIASNIFVFDFRFQRLLQFDKSGKFKRRIGSRGKGPEEFIEIRDFCVADSFIYTLDYQKIHCYHAVTGNQIDTWSFDSYEFNPTSLLVYNKHDYFLWDSNPNVRDPDRGTNYMLRYMDKNKIKAKYFKHRYPLPDDSYFYQHREDKYAYLKPIEGKDTVFRITKDSISAAFAIDFGDMSITPKRLVELKNDRDPNAFLKSKAFKAISHIMETENYIYFRCIGPETRIYEGVINKITGQIQLGKRDYIKTPNFFFSEGNVLYGYYEPYKFIEHSNSESEKNNCYNFLRDRLQGIDAEDNIILVKVHLK